MLGSLMSRKEGQQFTASGINRWVAEMTVQFQTLTGQRELLFVRVTYASTSVQRQLQEVCYGRR